MVHERTQCFSTLLSFLATAELDAASAIKAIRHIVTPAVMDKQSGTECAPEFVTSGCVPRILGKLRDGPHQTVEAAAGLLAALAHTSKDIAENFMIKGAFGILCTRLAANKQLQATYEEEVSHVLSALARLVQKADGELLSEYCIAPNKDFPEVRRLLKVSALPRICQAANCRVIFFPQLALSLPKQDICSLFHSIMNFGWLSEK